MKIEIGQTKYYSTDLCLRRLKRRRMSISANSSNGNSCDGAERTPGLLSARITDGKCRLVGACINGVGRENCCMPDVLGTDPPLVAGWERTVLRPLVPLVSPVST